MAKFSQNTIRQVAGFDGQVLAQELVWGAKDFWNLTWNSVTGTPPVTTPINLSGVSIDAQIIRRQISNLQDSRSGISFDIADYPGTVSAIPLTITNRVDASGQFTLIFDDTAWGVASTDPELDINASEPVAFSGRIKLTFPSVGSTPIYTEHIFLLFLVRSDGIIN